jgi:hypothetical protein
LVRFLDVLAKRYKLSDFVIPAKAGIQQLHIVLDAGCVIPDLIRDRQDEWRTFYKSIFSCACKQIHNPIRTAPRSGKIFPGPPPAVEGFDPNLKDN